jgi:hypothetical protein
MTPEELTAALRDPSTKAKLVELTPELKERIMRISDEMIEEVVKRTKGPAEAYMVMYFVMQSLEQMSGIRGAVVTGSDDH